MGHVRSSNLSSTKFYKPFAVRIPVLCGLFAITVVLVGITEHACRSIPAHSGVGGRLDVVVSDLKDTIKVGRSLGERQISTNDQSFTPIPSTATLGSPADSSSTEKPHITSAPIGGYLCTKEDPSPQCQTIPVPPVVIPTPVPDSQESPPVTPIVIDPQITTPTEPMTQYTIVTPGSGYLSVGDPTNVAAPTPNLVVMNGQTTMTTPEPAAPASDEFVVGGSTTTLKPGETPVPVILVSNGQTTTQTPSQIPKETNTGATVPISEYIGTSTLAAVHPTATIVNSTGTYYEYDNGVTRIADQISQNQYIIVTFLPIILALLYMIPFRILDSTIREHEAFYQLQNPGGALAQYSLTLDYSASFTITTPFKSLSRGHFYVFFSSTISVVILLLAPLSSEALFVSLSGECGPNLSPCRAVWGIYPLLARIIEGILAFIAILLLLLILLSLRRRSGVFAEPLSIAGLATLLGNSPLLLGFREIDSRVSNRQLAKILNGRRYGVSAFTSYDGRACYGIVPTDADSEAGFLSVEVGNKGHYQSVHTAELPPPTLHYPTIESTTPSGKSETWHAVLQNLYYLFMLVFVGGLFALIAYYHWTSGETGFEHFMSSMGFGVRFMMATFGILLNVLWSDIDHDLRLLSPYRTLLSKPSPARTTILAPLHASPITSLVPSLKSRQPVLFLIALTAITSDFLPIFLANISFSPAMTKKAYTICTYVSMAILSLMLVSTVVLITRSLQNGLGNRHGKLPREPVTIAGKAMFLVHGGLVEKFDGLSELGTKERNGVIREWRGSYGMGIVHGGALGIDNERKISRFS